MHQSVLPVLVAAVACLAPASAQISAIKRAVDDAEARSVRTGVVACDKNGKVLYRHRALEAFTPASNMKVFTAAAVLDGLGSDFEFVTAFRVQDGELIVEASGDPNLINETASDPAKVLFAVSCKLRSLGIEQLRGVRLAPGSFTGPTRPPTWPTDQQHAYYCAPTSGFAMQQGTFVVSLKNSGGNNATLELVAPPAGYSLSGKVPLVSSKKGATYGAIDQGGKIKIRGKFYRKSPRVQIRTSMQDPERWYKDTLLHQLALNGIRITPSAKQVTKGIVHRHRSGIAPALRRMLEESSNFDAEQCTRVLGAIKNSDGSLEGGRKALIEQVTVMLGKMPNNIVIADGSGLSKQNRLTPGALVVAMFQSMGGEQGLILRDSLPVSGRSGTLASRFQNTDLVGRVRAKTGWIRGASALSGLVEMPGGEPHWFAILMNYDRSRNGVNKELKRIQESIVFALSRIPQSE